MTKEEAMLNIKTHFGWADRVLNGEIGRTFLASVYALIKDQIEYRWHDLIENPDDIPGDWLDNIMTIDSSDQISVHGRGYTSNSRAGGVITITTRKGVKRYIDETWNACNIFGDLSKYDDFTHIVAWRKIEPFERGNECQI